MDIIARKIWRWERDKYLADGWCVIGIGWLRYGATKSVAARAVSII